MLYKKYDKTGFEIKGYEFLSARAMRAISIPIARKLSITSFPPEGIAFISLILGLLSAFLFALGYGYLTPVAGIVLFCAWVLDFVDGDLARLRGKANNFGAWLDCMFGKVYETLIIPAICFAIYRNTYNMSVWILGFAILGCIYFTNAINSKVKLLGMKAGKGQKKAEGPAEIERGLIKTMLHELTVGSDIPFYAIIVGALFNQMYPALFISAVYMAFYTLYTIYATHKKVIELDR